MRHSSPDQTLKAYMREIPAGVRAAVDAVDSIFAESREPAQAMENRAN